MTFTTTNSSSQKALLKNPWFLVYLIVFFAVWITSFIHTNDIANWLIENSLVVLLLSALSLTYRKYVFSDLSYLFICVFLCIHVYGSTYTYAENPFGYWLQELFQSKRNHYDRIVHFNFGFLLAYPMRELFLKVFNSPAWVSWILPIEITLSISALYELIEWAVADVFFKNQGHAYLGTQGDIWDAQKDMVLATLGAILAILIIAGLKKTTKK